MPRPVHFEIHVDDAPRAIAFYEKLFGWTFNKWEGGKMPYWLITTGPDGTPGINGGMHPRIGPKEPDEPAIPAYVCTVDVDNVDAYTARVTAAGGNICVPKMAVPGVGWLAYAQDTERNIFGMMQNDPAAK